MTLSLKSFIPEMAFIDHKGIIRAKNVRGKPLDEWIDKLVKVAEKEAKAQ